MGRHEAERRRRNRAKRRKRARRKKSCRQALRRLESPHFFRYYLEALRSIGLVGETLNALVLLIVVISRLLARPLSALVKSASSAGKNWLIKCVLALLPRRCVVEITSASDKAFHYSRTAFRHAVVYLQERNQASGPVHPMRLLISEGKLIRIVARWVAGRLVTKKYVARGPVAAISTTTKNRLEKDEETRSVSIWCNESEEQSRDIVRAYTKQDPRKRRKQRLIWSMVHRILETRIGVEIVFPDWFDRVADLLYVGDLRVRRYYPAFVEACRTVCLIRSFLPHRKYVKGQPLELEFADFAITALIFEDVFVESLHRQDGPAEATRRLVEEIARKKERPVRVKDLVRKFGISKDRAYAMLRQAMAAGAIRQANKPERNNRKVYMPTQRPRFVPDPEKLFQKLEELGPKVRFVHPVTGEWVVYRRKK
jgi:hypothetical protein